jgi:galactose oxidase
MCGDAVMYDAVAGKIATFGGSPSYQDSNATNNVHLITIGNAGTTPTVQTLTSMTYKRAFANGVVLPNGQIFITGGQSYAVPFTDTTSTLYPELWDPVTQKFTILAPHTTPRNYHSTALLLLDGTIFNGGGGVCASCTTNHLDGQIFRPPYLFNSDGTLATRPVITAAPTTVAVGGTIKATTDSTVTSWSIIRLGTATHTVNTDQRRIALTATASGLTYSMTIPSDAGVALPGYWMLTAINAAGVPSVSKVVQVTL